MRVILLIIFIQGITLSVKAERILIREKYNLIIASDTVCIGENYDLTVDLKGDQNVIVLLNGSSVDMADAKGWIKFKAIAYAIDKNGMSKQRFKISIVFKKDTLIEYVTCFIIKPPMSNSIRRVQDSLTVLLSNKEEYKDIHDASYYQKYALGFASKFGDAELKEELGKILLFVIVDTNGKVVKYDIVKNTYQKIPLGKIQNALDSFQFEKFEITGNLKFSVVIYTVKGYRGNIIVCSDR